MLILRKKSGGILANMTAPFACENKRKWNAQREKWNVRRNFPRLPTQFCILFTLGRFAAQKLSTNTRDQGENVSTANDSRTGLGFFVAKMSNVNRRRVRKGRENTENTHVFFRFYNALIDILSCILIHTYRVLNSECIIIEIFLTIRAANNSNWKYYFLHEWENNF